MAALKNVFAGSYFFGTAWTPGVDQLECFEAHYHKGDNSRAVWRLNEADGQTGNDCSDLSFIANASIEYYAQPPPDAAELTGDKYVNLPYASGTYFLDWTECVSISGRNDYRVTGDWIRDPEQYFNKRPVYRNDEGYFLVYSYTEDFFGAGSYKWVVDKDSVYGTGSGLQQPDECSSEDVAQCSWGTECTLPPAECAAITSAWPSAAAAAPLTASGA